MSIVLGILTFFLIIISLFLVLIVLAQKAKSDGGVGAAMGGGMTEAAFGADTGNVLSKATIYAAVAFFVIAFTVYLGRIYERKHAHAAANNALPTFSVPASAAPVMTPPAAISPAAAPVATPAATSAPETPKKP
ncbi:MAG: preprotein translocase subunit SecG [Undibacterium sp.]|nr:preprotein translocase subunit SecG [Opitutaceae bacterium]